MPYWRLSTFYFFYFASLGALIPYWGLYLKSLNFSATSIGTMMAIIMGTKIISPNIWGWIADHTGKRMAIVRAGCLLSLIAFAGVFVSQHYWWLVLVMMLFSFFWNATLPQFEATTFTHLGEHTHRYSSIRLWGSIGFIVAVWSIGQMLDGTQITYLPVILMSLFIAIWGSSYTVPEEAAGHLHLTHEPLRKILKRPEVVGLLVICFLMQLGHGPYYTFYSIYLESHAYTRSVIGQLWAVGVIAELLIFLVMRGLIEKFGLRALLMSSLLLAALRWWVIGHFVGSWLILFLAQILHAASFGVYHVTAIQFINRYFTGKHQGRGQALYSSMSFGVGGSLGSYLSGISWQQDNGAMITFNLAGVAVLLGFFIAWRWIR